MILQFSKLILSIILMVPCVGLADTWTDPETGRTWSYRMIGDTAEITQGQYSNWTDDLIIPDNLGDIPVTSIGPVAFSGCSNFSGALKLPNGLTSIGGSAFYQCRGLTGRLIIPSSVTNISKQAFCNCSGFSGDLTIPVGVTCIGFSAFSGCSGLNGALAIPYGVKDIGHEAFHRCENICGPLSLPNSITNIGKYAFYCCSNLVGGVRIPEGVTRIAQGAFGYCSKLSGALTLPEEVTDIGADAFFSCSSLIGSLMIPNSVTNIGDRAFFGCSGFTGNLSIPSNVECIGDSAFSFCRGFDGGLTISTGVKSIGESAFSYCERLSGALSIPSSVTNIDYGAFSQCGGFSGQLIIPGSIKSVPESAFSFCTNISSVVIMDGVEYIKSRAFSSCSSLGQALIPNSVVTIEEHSFTVLPSIFNALYLSSNYSGNLASGDIASREWPVVRYEPMHAVEFDLLGGEGDVAPIIVKVATKYGALPLDVHKVGYAFVGWSLGGERIFEDSIVTNLNDHVLAAQWSPLVYEVGFNLAGGTDVSGTLNVTFDTIYGELPTPSRLGYSFDGWIINGEKIKSDTIVLTPSNHVLTASWLPNKYPMVFNANGGIGGCTLMQDYDTPVAAPVVSRAGYSFAGWSPSILTNVPAESLEFVAQWTGNNYEVSFDLTGGIGEFDSLMLAYDGNYGELPVPEREGYTFQGWSLNGNMVNKDTILATASNHVLTAVWQNNQYVVVFDACGGVGSVTNEQDYASEITVPEMSRDGYSFIGWIPEVAATIPASNVTYTAQWQINQYKVTFDANGGLGSVTRDQDFASEIVAPVVTREWYNFVGWSPNVAPTVPAHDVTYTAQWRRWKTSLSDSALGGKTLKKLYPSDYAYLTDVVLEEGVIQLSDGFFDGCNKIVRLTLPSTLTAIGCDDLPPKIKESLAYDADGFMIYQGWLLGYHNKDATTLTVPEGVIGIGSCALAQMYDLETVDLPQSLKYISEGAFREDTYLDNLVIPDGVEIIGDRAFEDCSFLQTLTLGNGIKSVGARAFAGCTQLSGAMFGEGLVEIGAEAFDGCWRMLSVSLPTSVTNVVSTAFRGCTSLAGVTMPTHGGRVSNWFAPIYAQIRDVTLLEGESDICVGMFKGCSSLRSIHLPDSVTNIAAQAFYGCSSLTEVRLPESLSTLGSEAFRNCSSLTAAALPENVTSIGVRAFQGCSMLSALTLPRGLESLPDYVFAGCSSLNSFVVPAAVTNLGNYIVSGSTTAIYYLGNAPAYGANVYGNASGSLKSYVILGTKGWDGRPNSRDIPASWNGHDILTWSANQFDVTFDANGGLFFPVVTNTYACEETTYTGYSLPPFEPVRKGMDFGGYWTEPSGGTRVFTSTRVLLTKPHTLYAHWKKDTTIKVRFNACGGTVSPAEDDYVAERPYCELPMPVREHFAFDGWWTEASGGGRVEISSEVPKAAHELFAHWTPNSYTIRFHANNGTDEIEDQYFTYGDTVTLRANTFSSSGNSFVGWALSEDGPAVYADGKTLAEVAAIQDNVIHLYAVWVSTRYTVRFDSHGGVGRMENQTLVKDEAAELYGCAFTRTGYTFAGWAVSTTGDVVYGDGENVVNVYEKTGADIVLYAVWEPIIYSLHYSANGGTGVMADQQMTYDEAASLAPVAFSKSGAWFRGWATTASGAVGYQDCVRVKNLSTIPDDVVTFYAVWQEKPTSVLACEDAFGGAGTVTLDESGNIVVTLTGDVSGTVEIPANVGAVRIDLNGHDMAGDDGPAIRIVKGDGDGATTRLAIVDTSEGEKGHIAGGGESAGIEVDEDAATGVKLDVEEGVGVFNGDGTEQVIKTKRPGTGKVTVPKSWKTGQKVTWKATADKGSVFALWEGPLVDSLNLTKNERRNPSLAFAVPEGFDTNQVTAVFIMADDDGLCSLNITQTEFAPNETLSDIYVTDDSWSYVTASVKGLPTGLKFDAKTMRISGKATKPGVYKVTVSATNATVKKPVTAEFEIVVPNLTCDALPNLMPETDAYGTISCGVAFDPDLVDCTLAEDGWTLKVSGLPAGLKYDAKTGKITGVPTKAGTFTVTFTATRGTEKETATITLATEALPVWATGTFAGYAIDDEWHYGSATMTVAVNGKISGKIALDGTNWTFSATSFSRDENDPLSEGESQKFFVIEAVAKAGKATMPVSFDVRGHAGDVTLPNAVVEGTFGDGEVKMWRNLWKDKATANEAKAVIGRFEGVYTVSVRSGICGSGYLSLTVGKDGNVKASGKLPDGTSASATSPLMYDEDAGWFAYLYASPSAYKGGAFAAAAGFNPGDGNVHIEPVIFNPQWTSRNPQATGEYGDGFDRDATFAGAYYDKLSKLSDYYDALRVEIDNAPDLEYTYKETCLNGDGKKETESILAMATAADTLWQDGMTVEFNAKGALSAVKATKPVQNKETKEWLYEGANDGALTVSFTQATGIFKGSYTFWYDYESAYDEIKDKTTVSHTSKKVNFEGILVQGDEPEMEGFCLWDATGEYEDPKTGKAKTYKYSLSFPMRLLAE